MKYTIRKINDNNKDYDSYIMEFEYKQKCYYYEAYNNKFVNIIEVMFGEVRVDNLDNNRIYVFFNNNDFDYMRDVISIFSREFSNLKFMFNILSSGDREMVLRIVKGLSIDYDIVYENNNTSIDKGIKRERVINQYADYDLGDNIYIKQENKDKLSDDVDRDYANYNGYNERFIDKNVNNIVNFRKFNSKSKD